MKVTIVRNNRVASVVLENTAVYGMDYMAEIFCEDMERVTGIRPRPVHRIEGAGEDVILLATCGHSACLDQMEADGEIDLSQIRERREVYGIFVRERASFPGKRLLIVAGSDKRGTIYGMFRLSEHMGVSPWVYWADAVLERKKELSFGREIESISKEPSVTYRGFFINDEQPCFGNWAKEKFGSNKVCPALYHHIFELLLRLKGNYMWPAMWRSDFTLDYLENAQLADKMGVIIGASHHEPCCRSGGEFQKLKKDNPQYGEDWSFLSNAEGITRFWKDGLMRNKPYESLITIGMRGECDSHLMPADATLEDNINVLKRAITVQKELIREYGQMKHPQLLAIYKEVEDYYQGDENTPGLKEWEVLKNDIMMLCDDNFGNLRTMPGQDERKHPGGYGMYYHFDYYGGPTSYLWINSTPLTKIWEQMTMAYDFGVKEAWIVNVGDIKNQELPLSYFLELAYDFDTWGTAAVNRTTDYIRKWLAALGFAPVACEELAEAVEEYVRWNGMCRPEVLRHDTYHPVHFNEASRMLQRVQKIEDKVEEYYKRMENESPLSDCFFEIIYYPVMASANIIKMQIYAGRSQYYASQRRKSGNAYSKMVEACILRDRELSEAYHSRNGGKWNHMQSVFHIGYVGWNDEELQYPDCHVYHPVNEPRLLVSVNGQGVTTGGNPWRRKKLFLNLEEPKGLQKGFEIANGGEGLLSYRICTDADWLIIIPKEGEAVRTEGGVIFGQVSDSVSFDVRPDIKKWEACMQRTGCEKAEGLTAGICIYGDNCEETAELSENEYSETRVDIEVNVLYLETDGAEKGAFLEQENRIVIETPHYQTKKDANGAEWKIIEKFGRTLGGVKVFPVTAGFAAGEEAPCLEYKVHTKEEGRFLLMLYTAPSNPVIYKGKMRIAIKVNGEDEQVLNTIPDEDYLPWASESWGKGVLTQIHEAVLPVFFKKGSNTIVLKAMDPAVVPEKIVLIREGTKLPESYLGPEESNIWEN